MATDVNYTAYWDDPNPPENQVTGYEVSVSGPTGVLFSGTVDTKSVKFPIDVTPNVTYTVSVTAVNAAGKSSPAEAQFREALPPPLPVTKIVVEPKTHALPPLPPVPEFN